MTNGLIKERITVFKNNGRIAFQGYNDKVMKCGKIFKYYRIDKTYTCANDWKVDFEVTEDTLKSFAEEHMSQ